MAGEEGDQIYVGRYVGRQKRVGDNTWQLVVRTPRGTATTTTYPDGERRITVDRKGLLVLQKIVKDGHTTTIRRVSQRLLKNS